MKENKSIKDSDKTKISFISIMKGKILYYTFTKIVSIVATIVSFILGLLPGIIEYRYYIVALLILFIFMTFIALVTIYYRMDKISFNINDCTVNIKYGDIFNTNGLIVIGFDDYFDTKVDGTIIDPGSLNGLVINQEWFSVKEFDEVVDKSKLIRCGRDENRDVVKKDKYELGQIIKFGNLLALSLGHMDEKYVVRSSYKEYVKTLLDMWDNIDELRGNNVVNLPLIGAGLLRMPGKTCQDLLETMLRTLKFSPISHNNIAINIVLYQDVKDKINLSRIKYLFNGGK